MPPRPSRKEYKRVANSHEDATKAAENEIRVVAQRGQRNYVSYAIEVLTGTEGKTKHDNIKITAMGAAVYNAVNIAEVVKRRVAGLHQTTDIASVTVTDKYEATEEGKEGLTLDRKVATITIVLSLAPLDTKHIGYQAPLPADQVTEQEEKPAPRERKPRAEKAAPAPAADGEEKPKRRERKPRAAKKEGAEGEEKAKPAAPAKADGEEKPKRRERKPRGEKPAAAEGEAAPATRTRAPREPKKEGAAPAAAPRAEGGRPARGAPRGEAKPAATAEAPRTRGGRGRGAAVAEEAPRTRGGRGGRGAAAPAPEAAPARGGRGGRGGRGAAAPAPEAAPVRGGRGGRGAAPAAAPAAAPTRGGRGRGAAPAAAPAAAPTRGGRGAAARGGVRAERGGRGGYSSQ